MSALDRVLADLVESDRECAYVTVKREPLEALIEEWLRRGDRIAILCAALQRAKKELASAEPAGETNKTLLPRTSREPLLRELHAATEASLPMIVHHRHAVRQELAARLKQALRSAITEIHSHITEALLAGNNELAERLESERQTVQIVISTIDALVSRLMTQELTNAGREDTPPVPRRNGAM